MLLLENGSWSNCREEIGDEFVNRFNELFRSSDPVFPENLDDLIPQCISLEDNVLLCAIPDEEEIQKIVFLFGSTKTPGPDGMSAIFYKSFWHIVKYDVIQTVQSFLAGGYMLKELNHTNVALISMIDHPSLVNHFRPISLCNVVYKIISKNLANRLRPLLDRTELISPF